MADKEFLMATRRAKAVRAENPRVISAGYEPRSKRLVFHFSNRLAVSVPASEVQGLERAKTSDLLQAEITPSGLGVHFPSIDADIYVPALLQGMFGSKRWMAAQLGAKGGSSSSRAKKAASRANGKLGGRPRKAARA